MKIKRLVNDSFDFSMEMTIDEFKQLRKMIEFGLDHCNQYTIKNEMVNRYKEIVFVMEAICSDEEQR